LNSTEALGLLQYLDGVVICPSIRDNLPYAIIEAQNLGLNIHASNVGGIPEILPDDSLFTPNVERISALIEQGVGKKISKQFSSVANWNSNYLDAIKFPPTLSTVNDSEWISYFPHWSSISIKTLQPKLNQIDNSIAAVIVPILGLTRPSGYFPTDLIDGSVVNIAAIYLRKIHSSSVSDYSDVCSLQKLYRDIFQKGLNIQVHGLIATHGRPCGDQDLDLSLERYAFIDSLDFPPNFARSAAFSFLSTSPYSNSNLNATFRRLMPPNSLRRRLARKIYWKLKS
jgi:hypothetical protein